MKKTGLVLSSFILSLVLCECLISGIVGYPSQIYGERKFVYECLPIFYQNLIWKPPHYRYWNTEDGINCVDYNNIGLTGNDITLSEEAFNVYLLGDSYVEARQYSGQYIAAGIVQGEVKKYKPNWQVINIGYSGNDPYAQWYRAKFYEQHYRLSKVVMIYESFKRLSIYFSRWENPSTYELKENPVYMEQRRKLSDDILARVKNGSTYISLVSKILPSPHKIIQYFLNIGCLQDDQDTKKSDGSAIEDGLSPHETYLSLINSINQFSSHYGDKFCYVSIMRDNPYEKDIEKYCFENSIEYHHSNEIMVHQHKINGSGHLNRTGNVMLGDYIASILLNSQ